MRRPAPQVFIRYASPASRYKERKLELPEDWLPVYREYLDQYNRSTSYSRGRRGGSNTYWKTSAKKPD